MTDSQSKILFLGYSQEQTSLIDALELLNCEVCHTAEKINSTLGYDLVVSYGYRHLITRDILNSSAAPIINLHISYLPWNRGAHPNFWSFFDGTPCGVSIHLIDKGIDTGPILYQEYVKCDPATSTFSQTYQILNTAIERLFKDHIDEIVARKFVVRVQCGAGTFHKTADLPRNFNGWNANILTEITRLKDSAAE